MRQSGIAVVVSLLLIGTPAQAESAADDLALAVPVAGRVGPSDVAVAALAAKGRAFDALSHGSQQITLALHFAQDGDGDTAKIWSIERIATAKASGQAWKEIHAAMQAGGSLDETALGTILSRGVAARARIRMAAARMRDAAPPPTPEHGAFRALPPADRRIAEALFDTQIIGPLGTQAWSLDQIATAKKTGRSWSRILRRLNAEGLVVGTRLSNIVSEHQRDNDLSPMAREVVVTDANGHRSVLGGR